MARSKAIDVTQCTGEVARHIEAITKKLSKQDHEKAIKLVEKIKAERTEWIDKQSLTILKKFHKYDVLEEISDQCVKKMPDVHRDFFRHKLFYVMNGIQQLVDKKVSKLKSSLTKAPAASAVSTTAPPTPTITESGSGHAEQAPPTQQPAAAAVSTPTDADTPTEAEGETDESDQWIDPDATIIEITQHHEEPSDVTTPPPTFTDASTQTPTQTQTQTRPAEDKQYCVGWCEFGGEQGNKPMTRCGICMRWHHVACVDGQDEEEYEGSWACPVCRDMPNRVVAMQTKLDHVMALLEKLTTPLTTTTSTTATSTAPPTELPSQPPQSIAKNKLLCGNRFQPLAQSPTSATSCHPATDDSLSEDSDTATLPPNQEMWKRAQKQKKQWSKTVRKQQRKRAFKATVLSDSVLAKVDV
jgi:hypothetical protein